MKTNNRNANNWRYVKPISRMNDSMMRRLDTMRLYHKGGGIQKSHRLQPTGGLALHLADNANKYSKTFIQGA